MPGSLVLVNFLRPSRSWTQSTLNSHLLRRFGSIPARAGLLSALIALAVGVLIAALAVGVLYFSLHGNIQQNLQARLDDLSQNSASRQQLKDDVAETGAGIDIVALFDSSGLVAESSSIASPEFPANLYEQVPDDGVGHPIDGVHAGGQDFHALAQKISVKGTTYTVLTGIEADKDHELYLLIASVFALFVPLFALLSGWLTFRSVRSSLAPVEQIRAEVENISSTELSRRVPEPPPGDEISALAHTMNSMLGRLEDSRATQLRFLGDASHELRSPIASISGLVEIAQITGEPIDLPSVNGILAPESARVQRLVDDLLASASAQDHSAPREEIDLDDLALAERTRLVALHPALKIGGAIEPVRVLGVPDALTRAVRNLTDNAAKYCRERISISVETNGSQAVISVEDDGEGVPDSAKELVLTRFGRTDESRNRSTGGAGLGLSIVNDIVRAHDGELTLADSLLGGARFEIRLSLAEES